MPPLPSVELDAAAETRLLEIARQAIESGIDAPQAPRIDIDGCDSCLTVPAAVFTTLTREGALRGCIGSLEARDPLARAVAESAFNAAFRDRRFEPLAAAEIDAVRIEISVLSAMEPIRAAARQALLEQLRPGIDGLIVEDRGRRATFLPKVWENIASPDEFLDQLLIKAGLEINHWSRDLRLQRYQTRTFGEK